MLVLPIFPQAKGNKAPKPPAAKKCNPFKEDCTKTEYQPTPNEPKPTPKPSEGSGVKCNPFKEDCTKVKPQPKPQPKPKPKPSGGSGTKCNPFKEKCDGGATHSVKVKPKPVVTTKKLRVTNSSKYEVGRALRKVVIRSFGRAYGKALERDPNIGSKVIISFQISDRAKIVRIWIKKNETGDDQLGTDLIRIAEKKLKGVEIEGYKGLDIKADSLRSFRTYSILFVFGK